jgi:hypothetical protein
MLRSKHPIKHLGERIRPRHPFGGLYIHQPNRNFEFGVLVQHGLNPLKELPNDSGQDAASRQLTGRGIDELRDGGEGVGHSMFWPLVGSRLPRIYRRDH